jgi:DNA-binding MarR family transcriptional regulator
MDFGGYFLKSDEHRTFLELLVSGSTTYSKTDLAKLSGLPYATTHAEVAKLEATGLLVKEPSEGSTKYRMALSPEMKEAFLLVFNLKGRDQAVKSERDLRASLQELGAPLVLDELPAFRSFPEQTLEETLVRASVHAKKDPSVARTLPLALFRNFESLNQELLKYWATRLNAKQELGFFLELSATLSHSRKLKKLSRMFKDERVKETKDFFETTSPLMKKLAERNTPDVAKRWKFRMNMSMDSFQSTFDRFKAAE